MLAAIHPPSLSERTEDRGCGSCRGRGRAAHDRSPARGRSPDRGHGDHPCAASSRARCGEERGTGREAGTDGGDGHGRDQSRSAKTPKVGCEPTAKLVSKSPGAISTPAAYLNLQHIVPADPLVVHLMVGIIGIATILVLHEREAGVARAQVSEMWAADDEGSV